MKIALIVPGFSAHEQDWCIPFLLDHVRTLAHWADVHVFTLRWPERGGTYPVFGAVVHALDGRAGMGIGVVSLWARALSALAAEHRRAPFDLLHAIFADEPGWVGAWAARWLGRPLVLSPMGGEFVRLPEIGYGFQLLRGRATLTRWAARQATVITAGSHYQGRLIEDAVRPRKLVDLPFGVDTQLFTPRPAPDIERSRPPGAGQRLRVISAGSLTPVKNPALLLRALAQVPEVDLQLAGDGPLQPDLRALAGQLQIADRVEFLGNVNHAVLPAVYQPADVLAQASRHEGQGLAVLEAAACGLPVVGTPVGVLPELGQAARDEAELVQRLTELRDDDAQRRRLGQRAYQSVQTKFALNVTSGRWRELYLSL